MSGYTVKAKLIKVLYKGLIFEVDSSIEGILSSKDAGSDLVESMKQEYSIDEEYDMMIQEVN